MATVTFIKNDDKKKRVQLHIDDGGDTSILSVSDGTYASIGFITRGSDIDEETLECLRGEDEVYRATKKAVSSLALSDRSKFSLKMKLKQAGFSSGAVEAAVETCVMRGYLDEQRQLERLVEREANGNLRGKYYIKRKLASKGYSISDIDRAIRSATSSAEVDFDLNFERLKEKKGASSPDEIAALKHKYGYKI